MSVSDDYAFRFSGIARLYGQNSLIALSRAHFTVIGLGGIGSWAAEALARSGVGELTLIELDDVCVSNTNRQLHALGSTVGQPKNAVMQQRLRDINPDIKLHIIHDFLDQKNLTTLIGKQHDIILDATDSSHIKAALAAYCCAIKRRLIMAGSSGGKRQPQAIEVSDLGRTQSDPMLAKVRTQLYRHHNFTREKNRKFRIDVVYSKEQMVYPKPDGSICQEKKYLQEGTKLDCATGFGSSVMVTGTFGFMMASQAIERYLQQR